MRDQVFGTKQAVDEANARLKARGVPQPKIDTFNDEAKKASTPDQINVLEAKV